MTLEQYYTFRDSALLEEALTHRSFAHEGGHGVHNERFELLGDAVIGLILTDLLLEDFKDASEGELSKRRAVLVNEAALASVAQHLDLGSVMRLGKGEMASGGSAKPRLLACAFEALVGAVYRDAGFIETRRLVAQWFHNCWPQFSEVALQDFKTDLQERVQERERCLPTYEVVGETGPAHDRVFRVQVRVDSRVLALGEGKSKKMAEQQAAKLALEVYQ
jgi:ribonuclease-3